MKSLEKPQAQALEKRVKRRGGLLEKNLMNNFLEKNITQQKIQKQMKKAVSLWRRNQMRDLKRQSKQPMKGLEKRVKRRGGLLEKNLTKNFMEKKVPQQKIQKQM